MHEADVFVGIMSGTSLDGITAACVRFAESDGRVVPTLLSQVTRPYAPAERARLEAAMQGGTAQAYCTLGVDLAHWLADAAELAITASGVPRRTSARRGVARAHAVA
jgi:anhydro-N-acetylmuramic acid kinase